MALPRGSVGLSAVVVLYFLLKKKYFRRAMAAIEANNVTKKEIQYV